MNTPISLAALLERFFTQRLMQQRHVLAPSVRIATLRSVPKRNKFVRSKIGLILKC
jgi:hypothetical protein